MKPQSPAKSISIGFVAASFIVAGVEYGRLPARIATHWNAAGQVNGYMDKLWGTFFMPSVMLLLLAVFLVVPKIDPKAEAIAKFKTTYEVFCAIMIGILFYIYALTLYINLGHAADFSRLMVPPLATLSFTIGWLVGRAEPNMSIGIRTPWTLASDSVWRRTHAAAGRWYYAGGILTLLGFEWPRLALYFILISLVGVSFGLVVYSYYLFRIEKKLS
jgi:uncharacterized membrane protein